MMIKNNTCFSCGMEFTNNSSQTNNAFSQIKVEITTSNKSLIKQACSFSIHKKSFSTTAYRLSDDDMSSNDDKSSSVIDDKSSNDDKPSNDDIPSEVPDLIKSRARGK